MLIINRPFEAYLDDFHTITILLPYQYHNGHSSSFTLLRNQQEADLKITETIELEDKMKYVCYIQDAPTLGETYIIKDEHGTETDLQIGAIIRTEEFDEAFYYDQNDLGVTFNQNSTTFKVWAPTATEVKVKIKQPNSTRILKYDLTREEKGIWSITLEEDNNGYYYTYLTCINLQWNEAIDPYATAVSYNSKWGCIVDLSDSSFQKSSSLPPFTDATDAIIYELHIRDFSSDVNSGIKQKGKYVAFTEKNSKTPNGYSTGITYIKDLGVTHVELLPFNDFGGIPDKPTAEEYNWGYNPLLFNAPEGSYSVKPEEPQERIRELKALIASLHDEGIRVIQDVVYNHVYIREESPFEKLVPGYYFRHDIHGMPSNGTGVGNDFASERRMASKFILDSVTFWVREYGVDGFRFDLMGILDTQTMNRVREEVEKILPRAIIIGEGWDLNTPLPIEEKATIRNAHKMPTIGQFNDLFRDSVKGSTFNLHDKGFVLGHSHLEEKIAFVLAGSIGFNGKQGIFAAPTQSVNYVESHDNYTLWDKMCACIQEDKELMMKRHRLASSAVILAQGIPFLHAGQEFFRTKNGVENSYNAPDKINRLEWTLRERYDENITYLKELIQIRKQHKAFRFTTAEDVRKHIEVIRKTDQIVCLWYKDIGQYGPWDEMLLVLNAQQNAIAIDLPDGDQWACVANGSVASFERREPIEGLTSTIEPISSYIFTR